MKKLACFGVVCGLALFCEGLFAQHYQYRVLIGDRDAERGILYYDYPSGNFGVLGICAPSPTVQDYYYGIAIHPQTGHIWVCNVLRNRIDVLDQDGNCVRTITGSLPRPHGIAIHPSGNKVVTSHNDFRMSEYDIPSGSWRFIEFANRDDDIVIPYLNGIYGIRWHPSGDLLYASAIDGVAEVRAANESLTNIIRCHARYNPFSAAWDVALVAYGSAGVEAVGTDDVWQGVNQPRRRQVGLYRFPQSGQNCSVQLRFAHPETDGGGLLFGIERAPDGTFWMTNYDRGLLYQLDPNTGQPLRRVQVGQLKVGLGVAIVLRCMPHNGDVNMNGCVDDADLLSVLFLFGSTERGIREDTNCDGVVDDADLLTVLFNFGAGC